MRCDDETCGQTDSCSQSHDTRPRAGTSAGGDKEQHGDRIESLKMSSGDGGFLMEETVGVVV
ncbi:hypothetical protein D6D08_10692 [Aureobasidium pullulans]|nr:hypothetical protein D6D08_10692 [Aureobasidium pullulans]